MAYIDILAFPVEKPLFKPVIYVNRIKGYYYLFFCAFSPKPYIKLIKILLGRYFGSLLRPYVRKLSLWKCNGFKLFGIVQPLEYYRVSVECTADFRFRIIAFEIFFKIPFSYNLLKKRICAYSVCVCIRSHNEKITRFALQKLNYVPLRYEIRFSASRAAVENQIPVIRIKRGKIYAVKCLFRNLHAKLIHRLSSPL